MEHNYEQINWEKLAELIEQEAQEGALPAAALAKLSAAEKEALESLRMPWDAAAEIGRKQQAAYPAPDIEKGKQAIQRRIEAHEGKRSRRLFFWQMTSVAAAAVALLMVYFLKPNATAEGPVLASNSLQLPDGTRLEMESGAVVPNGDFGKATRTVQMTDGKGTFHVAKDAQKPFVVVSPAGEVRVLGTVFTWMSGGDRGELSVAEGMVAVSPKHAPSKALKIGAGESAYLNGKDISAVYANNGRIGVQGNKIAFEASLADVARFIADWHGIKVKVAPALQNTRVVLTQPVAYSNARAVLEMALLAADAQASLIEKDGELLLMQ